MAIFDLDRWAEIFESLSKNKLRTGLTAFSIFWGIFLLIILLGFSNGIENYSVSNFSNDAQNSIWIRVGETTKPYKGLPVGRDLILKNEHYNFLTDQIDSIEHKSGQFNPGIRTVRYKDNSETFTIRAIHPGYKYIDNATMETGRYINQTDIDENRKVVVIDGLVNQQLFLKEDPIGKLIEIGGILFKVVGVVEAANNQWERRRMYLPISTAQKVFAGHEELNNIQFTVKSNEVWFLKKIEEKTRSILSALLSIHPDDKLALRVKNRLEESQRFFMFFYVLDTVVWIVGLFSIIAGVIGISNIMLITVKERTRELGIRKALGATPGSILFLVLAESVVITLFAGYIGLVVGVGVLEFDIMIDILDSFKVPVKYFLDPTVSFNIAVYATIVLVVSGTIAGFIPALRASRINPIEAIREE